MRFSFRSAARSPVFWLSMVGVVLFAQNADVQLPGDPGRADFADLYADAQNAFARPRIAG